MCGSDWVFRCVGAADPAICHTRVVAKPVEVNVSPEENQSAWSRFLAGRTGAQRFVLAIGALAAALVPIGVVVAAIVRVTSGGDDGDKTIAAVTVAGGDGSDGSVRVIENQSEGADEFIMFLLDRDGGAPVQLNHQVMGVPGPGDVTVQYNCDASTGCSLVRVQDGQVTYDVIDGGVWFVGCYGVVKDGAGYGAQGLDIELHYQGEDCP